MGRRRACLRFARCAGRRRSSERTSGVATARWGNVGKRAADIRKEVTAGGWYASLAVDGTIRAETTKDDVNDILTYKAAACAKVRQAIAKRTSDEAERKRLYTLLKSDKWLEDKYLHRMMRKYFRHGVSSCDNQFIVRSDKHESCVRDGHLVITIHIARQYGPSIELLTNSNGKNVDLTGCNLRVIVRVTRSKSTTLLRRPKGAPAAQGKLASTKAIPKPSPTQMASIMVRGSAPC